MHELESRLAELDRQMEETKHQFRERLKQLRKTRRLAAKALEHLRALDH